MSSSLPSTPSPLRHHFSPLPKPKHHFLLPKILCSNTPPPPLSLFYSLTDFADNLKELGMQKPRPLYTPDHWRSHRSSLRHLHHLLSSLTSRVILSLIPPVAAFTSFAAALALYNSAVENYWFPDGFPLLHASSLPYQLTAPALALLLVFRTEASYSRFEEGRKAWMKIIAGTGELVGMVMAGKISPECRGEEVLRRALVNYILAFPVALKCHVVNGSDIRADLKNLLDEDDVAVIAGSKHLPFCVMEFINQSIHILKMEETKRISLESKLCCFHEGIAVCEQLMGIPIPLSYTRLTSRFLVLWHLTLPVILWDDCNWIVIPATFISAASLFCIEEVGVLIEEPFSMLALDELCKQLQDSVRGVMAVEKQVHIRLRAKMNNYLDNHHTNGWPASQKEQG